MFLQNNGKLLSDYTEGIIQYRRNVKVMMSGGALTEFQKRSCNINKRKKKFEITSKTLEGFVGFKFSVIRM